MARNKIRNSKITSKKTNMKIEKGQKYLCTADYYLMVKCMWHKGKIYEAIADDLLRGEINTYCIAKDLTIFQPLSSAKWAIKRTPENAEVVNRWAASQFVVTPNVFVYHDKLVSYELLDGYTEIDFETFKEITGVEEEKPKQLLGEKEAVHCPTLELAEKVIDIFKHQGIDVGRDDYWNGYREDSVFDIDNMNFSFCDIGWYERNGYEIIPAEQFIKENEKKILTIEDVMNGKCAIENDGTVEELNKVLKAAFPNDIQASIGTGKFYARSIYNDDGWNNDQLLDLPTQSVKLFLSQIEEKEHPTEEWQPKWGEPVEVTLFGKRENVIYVSNHPTKNNKHICVRGEGLLIIRNKNLHKLSIHEFTTEQAKQDLAKLHSLNPEQIKITE